MAAIRGRYKRNRHILGEPLSEVEVQTLQEMSRHHRHADFRRRALGVLALNEGRSVEDISGILRVTVPPVYKWARAWRERGLMGMLSGHVGGPPRKLTAELLDVAERIARQEALTLGLKLTPFHGHLIVLAEGVRSEQTAYPQAALSGAIS